MKKINEFQLKIEGEVKEDLLLKIGAKKLGNITQIDRYYSKNIKNLNKNLLRIRDDNKGINVTLRDVKKGKKTLKKEYENIYLKENEIKNFIENNKFKFVCEIIKNRTIYQLGDVIINVDKVINIGNYIEFQYHSKINYKTLINIAEALNLNKSDIERLTYIELYIKLYRNKFLRFFHYLQRYVQDYSYAIISSLIIYLGIIFGIGLGTRNKFAIISALLAVIVSDSLSDGIAKYTECKSRDMPKNKSIKISFLQILVKVFIGTLFLFPFLLFKDQFINYKPLIIIFIFSIIIITVMSIQISKIEFSNKYFTIIKYFSIIILVAIISYALNKLIINIFK